MHVLYLYFFTYVLCLCECVHAEEGSEKKKGTSSSKSCNHARKSNTANAAL